MPATLSPVQINQKNKHLVWTSWQRLEQAAESEIPVIASQLMTENAQWHGFDPLGSLVGAESWAEEFWLPLRRSFPGLRRQSHMFFGGLSAGREDGDGDEGMWVGGTGYFHGRFEREWLGIPPSGKSVSIRWGELCQVQGDRVGKTYFLVDLVDFLQQSGFDVLPKSRGLDGYYPAPRNDNAIYLQPQDERESATTLDLIRRFIFQSLNVYDRENLGSMGVADYFPADIQWYGPGGIGACLSLREFEDLHQRHWLHAFPDRAVQDLDCLFAEGGYTAGAGWNGVLATHNGRYLDAAATGRRIGVTGLDFWRREGAKFIENWVFVDMIHLFRQFGVDLLQRVK